MLDAPDHERAPAAGVVAGSGHVPAPHGSPLETVFADAAPRGRVTWAGDAAEIYETDLTYDLTHWQRHSA